MGYQPVESTQNYEGVPQSTDNTHSMEPSSSIMYDPSIYPTVGQQSAYPSMQYQDPSVYPSQSYDPHSTEQTVYDPSMYPSSSHEESVYPSATMVDPSVYPTAYFHETQSMHTTEHFESTMNSEPFDASEPSMPEPTVGGGSGCEAKMYATFYFTLSLYD